MMEAWDTDKHLSMVEGWHGGPVDPALISDTGVIIDNTVAGWVYFTNSKIAHVGSYVADPAASKADRKRLFRELTDKLYEIARLGDATRILSVTEVPFFQKLLHNQGFRCLADRALLMVKDL